MKEEVRGGIRVVTVDDWSEYLGAVQPGGKYASWAFRGQSDAGWSLFSSLSRCFQRSKVARDLWPLQEARIIRIFKRKAHLFLDHVPADSDNFQWLSVMQHHGAPTRLLDFTWSPYVAAFFALEHATKPSAVWAIHPGAIWKAKGGFPAGKTADSLDLRCPGVFQQHYLEASERFVWQGEPMIMNKRLSTQNGTFFVPSVLDAPIESLLTEKCDTGEHVHKFVFEPVLRERAMLSLYHMNVTNASLFPDLDGLARSMAYEAEFHWALDLKTGAAIDGFELAPFSASHSLDTIRYPSPATA